MCEKLIRWLLRTIWQKSTKGWVYMIFAKKALEIYGLDFNNKTKEENTFFVLYCQMSYNRDSVKL